ncbi:glycoside hydrolase family 97 protein [Persicobacter diffluens]|uniref:Alpha-glucosidase n=1 Tax=Persicobacter diffluens TaxID=981 RepID=A0AAN5AM91_9BACT|nr:alpha-glucosidase [Persicobacter diffluens]
MIRYFLWICLVAFVGCQQQHANQFFSPDQTTKVEVAQNDQGRLQLKITDTASKNSIELSNLGIDSPLKAGNLNLDIKEVVKDKWQSFHGFADEIDDDYQPASLEIMEGEKVIAQLQFRLFNHALAYRFVDLPANTNQITEQTTIGLPEGAQCYAYNFEQAPKGPFELSEEEAKEIYLPLLIKTENQGYFAIQEGNIDSHAPIRLRGKTNNQLAFQAQETANKNATNTSWRIIQVGNDLKSMLSNQVVQNVNPQTQISDLSWIKPGKSLWDWRVWGYRAPDGFEYGLNTPSHKRMIDFAAENNVQYLLLDADWYGFEFGDDSDPTTSRPEINIEEEMAYAKEKGVGLILYLNDKGARLFGLERVLKQFSDWGAVGIKYGFMRGTEAEKVKKTKEVIELCAKHKLMVIFHDKMIPNNGDERTWPNLMSKEFGYAQADAHRVGGPSIYVNTALVNQMSGPLDLTNGWFDLNNAQSRPKVYDPIPSTITAELAKLIITRTGWMILPDAPEAYLQKPELWELIAQFPAQFDNYHFVDGALDEYVSVARRSGEDWFLGAITTEKGRKVQLNTDFLEAGTTYEAKLYLDAEDSDFQSNKEAYTIDQKTIKGGEALNISMAPGGGVAVYFKKLS